MKRTLSLLLVAVVMLLAGCSVPWASVSMPEVPVTSTPQASPATTSDTPSAGLASDTPSPPVPSPEASALTTPNAGEVATDVPAAVDPFQVLSQGTLLAFLEDLTAIQPYSGWRSSASLGEAEALDYVEQKLKGMEYLETLGLELERQSFHVFLATEIWETRLHLTVDGQESEVPADGLRGPRDSVSQARRFDSDGVLNDSDADPQVVEGEIVLARSADDVRNLRPAQVRGKIVFLDYAAVDRSIMDSDTAVSVAWELFDKGPAGLVLVTQFSNQLGESHGAFVGDNSVLNWVESDNKPPVLYLRLEDLAALGIDGWDDLQRIQTARLTWDADVFNPGTSGNLVARVPGVDSSQAIILGAHIDSPNAPGALDDGSGSAILLEVARVLNLARVQPPTDLYLVWFGSEELSLYGASHFVATHQELLDRTRAMLQVDALGRPLEGLEAELRLVAWPYGRHGHSKLVWPEALTEAAAGRGVATVPHEAYFVYSDNSTFTGFDVPNADLIYEPLIDPDVSIHYASHFHDPYDTVELAREVGGVFEDMARVALAAVLDVTGDSASLRVSPRPDRRAVFVGSHTEMVHMTPVGFTEFGMTLAMAGFDVDLIPYGQPVVASDLEGASLVVALPVLDYPTAGSDVTLYDEAWTEAEIDLLQEYVASGGLLLITNSRHRLKYGTSGLDPNEDWEDANALASRFGVMYRDGATSGSGARTEGDHLLLKGVTVLELGDGNGVPFEVADESGAQPLAWAGTDLAAVLLPYGASGGQVLVLADVASLSAGWSEPQNLLFWRNLANYVRAR